MGWLDGKVGLLVGGGAGIGRAAVDAFIREGAKVAVLELDAGRCADLESAHPGLLVIQGDATSWIDNQRAVADTVAKFGRIDALATFVGIFDYYTPLTEIPAEDLDAAFAEIFDVNVKSYLLSVKAARDPLVESNGAIALTLSTSSFYPGRGGALYVATKFATRGLVVQLGYELAPNVRVNGVAPGGTLGTDLRGVRALGMNDCRLGQAPNRAEELAHRSALGVALEPEDHAAAYVFLVSDRSRGITGTVIHSDGGVAVRG